MSFFLEQDEEKNPGLQNPSAPLPQSSMSSGQGVQNAPTQSGGFTDIRKYLDANQGQVQGMGQKVADNLQTQLGEQETAAKTANDTFNTDVNAQNPLLNQDQIKAASLNAAGFAKDPTNVQNFSDTYNKVYAGPTAPVDTSTQANKVTELSDLTKTSGGRQELVKGIYQQPNKATTGQLSLDNALIQGTPDAIKTITDKQGEADRISKELADFRTNQQDAITGTQKNIADRKSDIENLFWQNPDSAYNTLLNNVNTETTTAQKKAETAAKQAADAFNLEKLAKMGVYSPKTGGGVFQNDKIDPTKLKVSQEALDQLGLSKKEYIDVLNKINATNRKINNARILNDARDPNNPREQPFLNQDIPGLIDTATLQSYIKNLGTTNINSNNVANSDQYAELAALNQLIGGNNPQLDFGYLSTPNKAGSYNADITNFNKKSFNDFINDIYNKISTPVKKTPGFERNSSK